MENLKVVEELAEYLSQLQGVATVYAVAKYYPDVSWVDFRISLKEGVEPSDIDWDSIQDAVIDAEWKSEGNNYRPMIVNKPYVSLGETIIFSK
jgi:hypothetical protein